MGILFSIPVCQHELEYDVGIHFHEAHLSMVNSKLVKENSISTVEPL